ncbi:MAG: hypothetical protein R3E53_05130 [Myxococcota bacterium]|nr:hypothetical protein [Myxococcales bacterium]
MATKRARSSAIRQALGSTLALALAFAGAASAQPRIWATVGPEDTGDAGPIALPDGSGQILHLWASAGSTPSSGPVCAAGAVGDELCGVAFELAASGNFVLQDFVGDPAFDSGPSALTFRVHGAPGAVLRANNLDLGVPGVANRHLGTLVVGGVDTAASRITVSGRLVGANLELRPVPVTTIVLPEPGTAAALAIGALGLLVIASRRVCSNGSTRTSSPA